MLGLAELVAVFVPVLEGQELTFVGTEEGFFDEATGSKWNVAGTAVSGKLGGAQLERITHLDTFWFAWSTYAPDTDLVEP